MAEEGKVPEVAPGNQRVFFDITIGGRPAGRIIMEVGTIYVCPGAFYLLRIEPNKAAILLQ